MHTLGQACLSTGSWTRSAWVLEIVLVLGTWAWLRRGLPDVAKSRGDLLAGVLVGLQLLNEHVVPTPTSTTLLGLSAYALYLGSAALAWRVDRATARPAAPPAAGPPAPPGAGSGS